MHSPEGEGIMTAMVNSLKLNDRLLEETRTGMLRFFTSLVELYDDDEDMLYECQLKMERVGCLSAVTHLFEGGTQCSFHAVQLGKAVLFGGNSVLQDSLLAYFQSRGAAVCLLMPVYLARAFLGVLLCTPA